MKDKLADLWYRLKTDAKAQAIATHVCAFIIGFAVAKL